MTHQGESLSFANPQTYSSSDIVSEILSSGSQKLLRGTFFPSLCALTVKAFHYYSNSDIHPSGGVKKNKKKKKKKKKKNKRTVPRHIRDEVDCQVPSLFQKAQG